MSVMINISELKQTLELTPSTQNIMLVGKHGIGKSEILTSYFNSKGMKVVTLFLGQMADPGDIIGIPSKVEQIDANGKATSRTDFTPPYWFPQDGKPIVLFLDELNRARPEILQTVMDLTLNRKLAGKALPKGSYVISAVNDGDEYQLTDLDPALVSRFNIYEFKPTVEEWLNWAVSEHLDDRVVDFIQDNPTWLDGNNREYKGLDKTADRRAWKHVSDVIHKVDTITDIHKRIIAGIVGVGAAAAFIQSALQHNAITGKDLLLKYDKTIKTVEKYQLHEFAILNESVFRFLENAELKKNEKKTVAENLGKYIDFLSNNSEALANFTTIFEKDTYIRAASFMVINAPKVYNTLNDYVEAL
ncbi:MoxR-like ATPase [Prevotella sp. khp1]|uniref:AAA family ATPase n=1 Tax=Prevotellaceae TaxID=171552 RepID=UPI00088443A2|nr:MULTISPECIES: AAA family ATPase [Prevotellaceae]QVJ81651.1 AAA family ATPase [Xylanibacter ruminicola]SDQ55927.1 MoxR-like ATPase [Prevotella sp. khp1]